MLHKARISVTEFAASIVEWRGQLFRDDLLSFHIIGHEPLLVCPSLQESGPGEMPRSARYQSDVDRFSKDRKFRLVDEAMDDWHTPL